MVNKRIMINGVDVSECYFCNTRVALDDIEGLSKCNEIKNCFYKQQARLNEQLKKLEKENKLLLQYAAYSYYGYDKPMKLINKIGKLLEKQS